LVFVVAEIGSNWEGDVNKAKQLIKECQDAGAGAVKMQMWKAEDLYDGKYKKYELTFPKVIKLIQYSNDNQIEFFCSVFYPRAVQCLEALGVKRYKIASRTCAKLDPYWWETVMAVRDTHKPVIISNGMGGDWNEIREWFATSPTNELYCISEYPTKTEDIDLDGLDAYDGFSDHTLGIEMALIYGRMQGHGILEKHVKLKDSKSPDAHFSITTQELATLITRLTSSSDILG